MHWLMNLSTRTKLLGAFSFMCAMLLAVGAVGYFGANHLHEEVEQMGEVHLAGTAGILLAEVEVVRLGHDVQSALIELDEGRRDTFLKRAEASFGEIEEHMAAAEKTLRTSEGRTHLAALREAYAPWSADMRKTIALAREGRSLEATDVLNGALASANKMSAEIDGIRESKLQLGAEAVAEAQRLFATSQLVLVGLLVLSMAFALFTGLLLSNLIANPLGRAEQVLAKVADGDFTVKLEVHSTDEVGRLSDSLNATVDSMRRALQEVGHNARSLASSSSQLTSAAQSISSGAQEQASSLEETAASLEEMTSTVKQNADNAQQAAQLAQGARDVAEKGGHVVGTAVDAMKEINNASRKIADIITTIDEIAFQTNLLALNAAVEAARAGEQGRGFAVVAGEVRNLAQRSATAAKEIKGLIQDTVEKVESGSRLVNQSGQTLDEIVVSVKKVTDLIAEIAAASKEQSSGIDQVNTAVTQMDSVTQSNASQTEELAGTSEALASQAQQLMALVERFQLGDGANRHAATQTAEVHRSATSAKPVSRHAPRLKAVPGGRAAAKAEPAAKTGTHGGFEEF